MKRPFLLATIALFTPATISFWSGLAYADTLLLHPSGAATNDQTNQYIGGTAATALDTNDGSTSYGDLSSEDTARLALDDSGTLGAITSVRIRGVLRGDGGFRGDGEFRIGLRTNGTDYWSGTFENNDSYQTYSGPLHSTNPNTGTAWTWADINALNALVDNTDRSTDLRVTELFAEIIYQPPVTLTVTKMETGTGTVTSSPVGINCGATCSAPFNINTSVTLTATPAANSTFTGWTGCNSTSGTSCTVTMNVAKTVTASFTLQTFALTVNKSGTGTGTVTSSPAGVNCGITCSASFNSGTVVTLTASPSADSNFIGWAGACTGTGSCVVTMDAAKSVTATFTLQTFSFTVAKTGTGIGTVTSNPAGINCGADCSQSYDINTQVTLTATPAADSDFTGWSGACLGTGACNVTMDAAKSATANFTLKTFTLTVTKTGSGTGVVASSPAGINCGTDCSETYDTNTLVFLTATSSLDSVFSGWSGACSGGAATCSVTVDAAKTVTGNFTRLFPLSILKTGTGAGTVTSSPTGIDCGGDCSETYLMNTVVTLTATPDVNSNFTGWSGGCTGTGNCTVTLDAAKSVTATFTLKSVGLSVTMSGNGGGTVTSLPAGINCPTDCSEPYTINTQVSLTATPNANSDFTGWSGSSCSGTGDCVVTVDAAKTVTATFAPKTWTLSVTTTGNGTVTSNPGGIDCGSGGNACSASFNIGAQVTLTAAADTNATFINWSGACSGTGSCVVTMEGAKSVTADFGIQTFALTVAKSGTGGGTVSSSPVGMNCGATCSVSFNIGTTVTLTATPTGGATFTGWSGACSGTNPCVVTMDAARSVTAIFTAPITYTVTVNRTGNGVVTSSDPEGISGINCGNTCSSVPLSPAQSRHPDYIAGHSHPGRPFPQLERRMLRHADHLHPNPRRRQNGQRQLLNRIYPFCK